MPLKSFTTNWSKFNSNLDSRRLGLAACCFRHTPVMVQECSPLSPEECTKARGEFASYYSIPASERKALRKDSRARVSRLTQPHASGRT